MKDPGGSERGATAVVVGLLMIPLVGFAALSVDVGSLYVERGELQNGADSAAVAVALSCAKGACNASDASTMIQGNNNAFFGVPTLPATVNTAANCATPSASTGSWVQVDVTSTNTHPLASLLGVSPTSPVSVSACARWGYPAESHPLLPLAISQCDYQQALAANPALGQPQLVQYANPQGTCATAGYPAGGFGWLQQNLCVATITDGTTPGKPGVAEPSNCTSVLNAGLIGKTILIPIFDSWTPSQGQNGQPYYHVAGFGAFVLTGWKFSGNNSLPDTYADPNAAAEGITCTGSCRGLQGYFTHIQASADLGVGGQNFGSPIIQLVK